MHETYFLDLQVIHTGCIANILSGGLLPKNGMIWEFTNEIKPLDIYCYLYAKYGEPNGLQSLFRKDDSNNLIHWEWTFTNNDGLISILGMNFRTEIHLSGDFKGKGLTLEMFISQVKGDIGNYGKKISEFRKELEKWTQFVNPFKRIKRAVTENFNQLDALSLNPTTDRVLHPKTKEDMAGFNERWMALSTRYSAAVGLVFGLRSMLPVLAESFINLLIFVLAKPEIKNNERLFQNTIRQPIDIRIQFLHLNCIEFRRSIDYSAQECRDFHTLMNERNDLLHGNVEVGKLSIGEIFFRGKVPLFIEYEDFWSISIGASMKSVRFDSIHQDHKVVEKFISFITTQLEKSVADQISLILDQGYLGFNAKTGRLGVLISDEIADFRAFADHGDSQ
ncbi:hypothetical protein RBU55_01795 [Pseudomonas chlororaphis subsp. aurantiaca]|uniref:hypothetical protein n=1 Tax=Pseudomonas chlororaphis TaxID=587753 RepID=UPI0027DC4F66|nr:hypothetical protein [Pseudomonas chlororaphis]WMJ00311.1 hypothetical protein RBU55_01795 [Pseudomonas chlororaphis subsp. aurantiaca]